MRTSKNDRQFSLAELAAHVGGETEGNDRIIIRAAAPIATAGPDDISFVSNPRYSHFILGTKAGALVLSPEVECRRMPVIRHTNPYLAFAQIVDKLYPTVRLIEAGTHASAYVAGGAEIAESAGIGPLCHIGRNSRIGENCQLLSSIYIGDNVEVGDDTLLYPGVRIMEGCRVGSGVILHSGTVIGSDGFGFVETETGLKKIKQIGWVEVGDLVEIGSNSTVDRGAIGPTRIGRGTKIDNLVQIAHNVEIGQNSIIVAQVGVSGSTKIGNGVILAGQVGLVGHIDVGDGVRVGAQSGVSKSIPAGKTMFGSPAREIMETKRIEASLTRLPELFKRVRKLEEKNDKSAG